MSIEAPTFDFTTAEKVFDVSLYKDIPSKRRKRVIANHLAGIVLEAGDRPIEERINPWYVAITPEGQAIDLVSRQEVSINFGNKTSLAREERKGAIDFYYNKAVKAKEGELIYWFSPSGGNSPYKEARVNVAKVRILYGMKVLECYGIPAETLSEEVLALVENSDDLRQQAFVLSEAFLDSKTRQIIADGTPKKIKNEAYKAALPIAEKMGRDIESAVTERDFVWIGAYGERQMIRQGWLIKKVGCPGVFNSDLLEQSFGLQFGLTIDGFGNFRRIETSVNANSDEYGSLEFKCPSGHRNRREHGKLKKYCDTCGCDVSCDH